MTGFARRGHATKGKFAIIIPPTGERKLSLSSSTTPMLSPSSSSLKHHYRQIVALNNMGVALLEREAFHEAVECFKQAVLGMQNLFAVRENDCTSHLDHSATIEQIHQLLSTKPKSHASVVDIKVLSEESGFGVLDGLYGSTRASVLYPILIDGFQPDLLNVDIYSAIILHNFSTAHLSLAHTVDSALEPGIYKRLLASAQSIAYLAYQTVSNLMIHDSERDFHAQILQETSIFVTAMASLQVLITVLSITDQVSSLHEVWRRQDLLGRAISEAGYALEVSATNAAAAA